LGIAHEVPEPTMRNVFLLTCAAFGLLVATATLGRATTPLVLRWGLDPVTLSSGCNPIGGPSGGQTTSLKDENDRNVLTVRGCGRGIPQVATNYQWLLPGAHTFIQQTCYYGGILPWSYCDPPFATPVTIYTAGTPISQLSAAVTVARAASLNGCDGSARFAAGPDAPPVPPPGMASPQYIEVDSTAGCFVTVGLEPPFTPGNGLVWAYDNYPNGGAYAWRAITTADPEVAFAGSLAVLPMLSVNGKGWIAFSYAAPVPPVTPKAGLWWGGQSESGWGLHVSASNDRLFVAGYIYDYQGKATWAVMPAGAWDATHTTWTGDLYVPYGAPFSSYDPSRYSPGAALGKGQLVFSAEGTATFSYLAGPNRSISYFNFAPAAGSDGPYQGLWWGGAAQNGWGLSIAQQGQTLFATWFTYDADGNPAWFYMPGATRLADGHYAGALYRTTGGPWPTQVPYDGAMTKVLPVGTLELTFSGADAGTLAAVVNGQRVTVPIQRFSF
jgi:hypothetical protein